MSKTTFSIIYWIVGFGLVLLVFLLFNFLKDKLIQWSHDIAKRQLDKMDPSEESSKYEKK